jgi:hypothetical protein
LALLPGLYFLARLYGNFANLWVKILARRARLWVALSKIPAFHRERGFIAKTKEQNHASRDPPLRIRPAGSAALQPETQRRSEKQNHDLVALSCEKPVQSSCYKGLLVLTG